MKNSWVLIIVFWISSPLAFANIADDYRDIALELSPVVYYTFSDITDGIIENLVEGGPNGLTYNSPNTESAGIFAEDGTSSAVEFTGSNYVETFIDVSEWELAVCFWFKTTSPNCDLFGVYKSPSKYDRGIYIINGDIYAYLFKSSFMPNVYGETINSSGKNFADGCWHQVVYTYGASILGQAIYVDGRLVASGIQTHTDFYWQDAIKIGYGGYRGGQSNCSIDEFFIVNSALNREQIESLYAQFSVLKVSSTPMERIQIDGTHSHQTDYACNVAFGQEIQLIAPQVVMDELSFSRWVDAKGNTITENNILSFVFEHDQEVIAEYEVLGEVQYYYVNDDIPEYGIAAGSDSADGVTKSSPKRSIQSVLTTYPDIGWGDIIYVSDGMYNVEIVLGQNNCGLTFEGRSPESSILTGEGSILRLNGVNQVYVHNLRFENSPSSIDNNSSGVVIDNCIFKKNANGALSCVGDTNTTIKHSRFIANSAVRGGAIFFKKGSYASTPKLNIENCIFEGNSVSFKAGAIFLTGGLAADVNITNSTFYGNTATTSAGGILDIDTKLTIRNNIFWANSSPKSLSLQIGSRASVTHCSIEGGFVGLGNTNIDPKFASAGFLSDNQTPDDPLDDFWVQGNYHLKSEAGRWLPDSNEWTNDEATSPCIDAGNPGSILGYEPADPNNIRINMGAYGGTSQASKAPYNWYRLSDMTNDGIVNMDDFGVTGKYWQNRGECLPADLNRDDTIDILDLIELASEWMTVGHAFAL